MDRKTLFLLSGFLNADAARDREAQYLLLREMASAFHRGEVLDRDAFSLLTEDALPHRALSLRRATALVEQTGAFRQDGERWSPGSALEREGLDTEALLALLTREEEKSAPPAVEDAGRDALLRAIAWHVDMTLLTLRSGDIPGLPAYFSCEEDGDRPIGFLAAGTANSDSLSTLCLCLDYLPACGRDGKEIAECIAFLLEKTLDCQCKTNGWDRGGFYPLEDQPDATHPTVDATCLGVMALCAFLSCRGALEERLGLPFSISDQQVMEAAAAGLDFLLRMQGEDGSFGIYRYENGLAGSPNENCTRAAMSTMGVCKGSGIFDRLEREELYPACGSGIARAYAYICAHTAESEEGNVWAPYFGARARDYSAADVLLSTAKVCRAWTPVWWQMEAERPKLRDFCRSLGAFWETHRDQARQVGFYRFTTPTVQGFSTGDYYWPSYADMLTAFSMLQAYNLYQLPLTKTQWELIEEAVRRAIDLQHPHGHLDNPRAKGTPGFAVTQAAMELLVEYRTAKGMRA